MHNLLAFDFAGTAQKLRDIRDLGAEVVVTCSVIANFMPKVSAVTHPVGRKIYQAFAVAVSFLALNWRKHLVTTGNVKQP